MNRDASYRAIVDSAIDAIIVMDANRIVRAWNPSAERLLGWTAEEALGQSLDIIVPERYRAAHANGVQRYLAGGEKHVIGRPFVDLPCLHKRGHEVPTAITMAEWVDWTGERFFTGIVRDVSERASYEQQRQLLIDELNHRVKNSLAIVQAIVSQTARHSGSVAEFRDTLHGRITSMALTHDLLTAASWSYTTLHEVVRRVLDSVGRPYHLRGVNLRLIPGVAVSFGLLVHELASNAQQYGAWSNDGNVTVDVEPCREGWFCLTWTERGGPHVHPPSTVGFGTKMLESTVRTQLRGTAKLTYEPTGVVCRVEAPLTRDVELIVE